MAKGITLLISTLAIAFASEPNESDLKEKAITSRCRDQDDFVKDHFDRSDWMYSQKERLSSVRLMDAKMVGSHHSGSYSIALEPFDGYSICQNSRIASQLAAGVRYVDVRVGSYEIASPRLRVGHGPHHGYPAVDVLQDIANFSRAHPKEFLLVAIKDSSWTRVLPKEKGRLIDAVASAFSDLVVTSSDDWFDMTSVTLGQIWNGNRSVLIFYGDTLLRNVDFGNGTLVNVSQSLADSWGLMSRDSLYDPWANADDIDALFQRLDAFYEARPIPRNKFYVSQLLLTSTPLLTEPLDKLTADLQRTGRIRRWLRDHPDHNIVHLDFLLGVGTAERDDCVALLDEVMGYTNGTNRLSQSASHSKFDLEVDSSNFMPR